MKRRQRVSLGTLAAAFFAVLVVFPVLFMVMNSFMSAREAENRYTSVVTPYNYLHSEHGEHYMEATLLPDVLTGEGYRAAVMDNQLTLRLFWNSVLLALPILVGQLIVSPLAAFAFEMIRFRGKELLFGLYVIVMLMPLQLLMVPHYIAAEAFGYNNTYWAVILPGIFAPFGVFLLRQQMKGINRSWLEAARMEGASEWQVFWRVVLPSVRPTMAALAVLTFADCWNIVDQAVVFIQDSVAEPLSVYLSRLVAGNPGMVFATACVYMFPALLMFLWGHDNMAHGIALSSVETGG